MMNHVWPPFCLVSAGAHCEPLDEATGLIDSWSDVFLACSVCPFYSSRADIVPSRYVNPTWAAYPPEPEKLGELYELV